jgi:hypothetical protein
MNYSMKYSILTEHIVCESLDPPDDWNSGTQIFKDVVDIALFVLILRWRCRV